jgi:lysozyme
MERITKISTNGLTVLKHLEGFRAKPYLDGAGVATIGYGSTYYSDGKRVRLTDKPISEYEASCLMEDVLVHFERSVDAFTRDDITQNEFDALVCFAYNCGTHALNKSTLLKFINDYKPEGDIRNQFMRWTKINGIVSVGLRNRRIAEIKLYFKE